MTQRRWACPRCGNGIIAPGQPRRNDVRRYCLPCSEATGKLVERVCPARERERQASRGKAAERAAEKRAKEREARAPLVLANRLARRALTLKVWEREGLRRDLLEDKQKSIAQEAADAGGDRVEMGLAVVRHACNYASRYLHTSYSFGLYLAAACEFFWLDPSEVTRLSKVLTRLGGTSTAGWTTKIGEAVVTLARQQKHETAKGRKGTA